SLTTPSFIALTNQLKEEHNINILNPLSGDLSVLRQSLLFSGLEAVSYNINRKRGDLKLFEFGKTYHAYGDKRAEFKYLTIFVTGNKNQDHWQASSGKSDFFYLKGTINALLERLGISRYTETPIDNDLFSEGLTISLGKKQLVDFGLVKKSILKHFDISQDIMF